MENKIFNTIHWLLDECIHSTGHYNHSTAISSKENNNQY